MLTCPPTYLPAGVLRCMAILIREAPEGTDELVKDGTPSYSRRLLMPP